MGVSSSHFTQSRVATQASVMFLEMGVYILTLITFGNLKRVYSSLL
jgi:hypothetical protein